MVKTGIIGHTGRLGAPLDKLLQNHPRRPQIVYTESRSEGPKGDLSAVEYMFLALPKGESIEYMDKCIGKKIIDLSEDHRGAKGWVYGLPEMNRELIKKADRVANPGCYATAIILGLLPIKESISDLRITATSGISGAGKEKIPTDRALIYKPGTEHSHLTEIKAALNYDTQFDGPILFVPERLDNTDRGIIAKIFAHYRGDARLEDLYHNFYQTEPFVRMKNEIDTQVVNHTIFADIKVMQFEDQGTDDVLIISSLDNIVKGGAGQAIHNFNLMNGYAEADGLPLVHR